MTSLAYEIDFPANSRVHRVVNIQYLTRYRPKNDPFHRVKPPPGPVEYSSDSTDSSKEGQSWELKRIVDHKDICGTRRYLVHWKGFGPKDVKWKTTRELKNTPRLLEEYNQHL